jgi:hypothetical protein
VDLGELLRFYSRPLTIDSVCGKPAWNTYAGVGLNLENPLTNLEPLTDSQKLILRDFYRTPDVSITVDKNERRRIWDDFVKNRSIENIEHLASKAPALYSEVVKALSEERNIQPAVFSECVYAQGIAEKFHLSVFKNYPENFKIKINDEAEALHGLRDLAVRYSYSDQSDRKILYQAGGAGGVDCALSTKDNSQPIMIEMKEPYARTSEPDLPKYGEDGYIISTEAFDEKYQQFKSMLEEQIEKRLNVFEKMGSNIGDFSAASIQKAVTENYAGKKFAHVICTEDEKGKLVMLPSNHVSNWAELEGEIRPSGRNSYSVWTPEMLRHMLREMDASIQGDTVKIPVARLKTANARGGKNVSRYKINPLFFVRTTNIEIRESSAFFSIDAVKQLNPSITAKMNFKGLDISEVRKFYARLI